ncbi:MAG: RNA polymerase sigma factor SigJ [Chloroflexota bacterium]
MPTAKSEHSFVEQFEAYRSLLFAIAYRMLGTVAEAEDAVQDTFLRVAERAAESIDRPRQYLTAVVTNLCINRLNAASTQREQYLGPWLPEPIPTNDRSDLVNPLQRVETYDSLSIAFLLLLEALSPPERATFLLHEVFGYKFREIGEMLNKNEAACRQLFRRAKQHITENRPRFQATPEEHERLLDSFIHVVEDGEIEAFLTLLAEDVVLVPDGGGERGAAINILRGRDAVAQFILGTHRMATQKSTTYSHTTLNGEHALLARSADGRPYFTLFIYGDGAKAQQIHVIAGRKLTTVTQQM